jgi:uncharacterized OsmC-like protein/fermentation-respiration switch protein FrsA (DUF1100 family)
VAYAVFAHCFTCGKDIAAASRIATALTSAGFAVLRFDFTGLGMSDGEFANTNFSSNTAEVVAAADWLRREHRAPQLLIGHSLGGAAVLAVAGAIPEVRAVATIGAPASPEHVARLVEGSVGEIEARGEAVVDIGGRPFTIRRQFLDDLADHRILDEVRSFRRALLVLHSPVDNIVGVENAAEIYEAAKHPKSFVSLDGADHLLSSRGDSTYVASMIAAFANRYVADESGGLPAPVASAQIVVAETTQGPFLNHVVAGRHSLLADEPVSVGGFDAGPGPYDLLAAALGTCTSMTVRMYADRKGVPLERVKVEVAHGKVHADDCVECADAPTDANDGLAVRQGKIDRFERVLTLEGDLDVDQRERLLGIADRCPVHRTLESSSVIATRLADRPASE